MNAHTTELAREVGALKAERRAVILAHNYQTSEVQSVADFIGDSLELARQAAAAKAEVIVFCGVHFMAETAKILAPEKTVLLPEREAGCPMADMVAVPELKEKKAAHPGVPVICYVNSSAAIKAESDICCTSANAAQIAASLDEDEAIFVPDKYLGAWVAARTGKKLHLWPGFCPTHARIRPEDILEKKQRYPRAKVVVHPECRPDVAALADAVLSTSGIIHYGTRDGVNQLIVGTEVGILHRLRQQNPGKEFIPATETAICPSMKLTTLDSIIGALRGMTPEVDVPDDIRAKALFAVRRMIGTA